MIRRLALSDARRAVDRRVRDCLPHRWRRDDGSTVAENAMTSVVVIAVFLLVCQFAYAAHVRSSVTMAASEAARAGARVGAGSPQALTRAHDLMAGSVNGASAVRASRVVEDGAAVMRVDITSPVPVLGPFGVGLELHTSGRAVIEERTP